MTRHLPPKGLADPESVARAIVAGIGRGRAVVYAPARWWLIMMIIRHLPRFVFHKLDI
jgi:short-subunit dehydrogenase